VTREDVDRWLADYVEAWMTYDRDKVEALFAEHIAYRYHPADEPITGRDAVVESWLDEGSIRIHPIATILEPTRPSTGASPSTGTRPSPSARAPTAKSPAARSCASTTTAS